MPARKRLCIRLSGIATAVALAALMVQAAALDHWMPVSIEEVRGLEHTEFHASHCHGSAAGCADSGGAPFLAGAAPATVPAPPRLRAETIEYAQSGPLEAPPAKPTHPPRDA
jgi:hypothetical protein